MILEEEKKAHIKRMGVYCNFSRKLFVNLTFEMISDPKSEIDEDIKIKIIHALSSSSGHLGIAGGQFFDLSLKKSEVDKETIIDMQNKKTGALMGFCTEVAPLLSHKNN